MVDRLKTVCQDCGTVIVEGGAVEGRVSHGLCKLCRTRRDPDNPIRYDFFFEDWRHGCAVDATWEEAIQALRRQFPINDYPALRMTEWSQIRPGLKMAAWYNGAMRVATVYIQGKYAGSEEL